MAEIKVIRLIFLVSFVVMFKNLNGQGLKDDDKYWQKRAEAAEKAAIRDYQADPMNVTYQFNLRVNKDVDDTEKLGTNSTRRGLRGRKAKIAGPCKATNPIDRCWRCNPNWASNRKKLAKCVQGFGRRTRGGLKGPFYTVVDSSDDDIINPKPGTLRHAVLQKRPLWIIFARSMVIKLKSELMVTSHKTIDARGANVHIAYGAQITLQFVKNVIIHGLHVHHIISQSGGMIRDSLDHFGLRQRSDGDGISVFGSSRIWIDHVSFSNCEDGLLDVVQGSTAITISNNHLTHHNDVMLLGASDSFAGDSIMQVTIAFNHFGQGCVQRMPACRWGFFHVVNNDYTHWLMYAIGGSTHPTIISQGNRFIAPPNPNAKQVTHRDNVGESVWRGWTWRSEGDLMMNGAFFIEGGNPMDRQRYSRQDMIKAKPGTYVTRLTRYAGALDCFVGKPC